MLALTSPSMSLGGLPEDQAVALALVVQGGLTYREVARRLGVEPATVLRWLAEGLRALRPMAAATA